MSIKDNIRFDPNVKDPRYRYPQRDDTVIHQVNDELKVTEKVEIPKEEEEVEKEIPVVIDASKIEKMKEVIKQADNVVIKNDEKSINFFCIGLGQAGGKIAEVFYKLGYSIYAINTARQDIIPLDIPERYKLALESGLGAAGVGKDMNLGRRIFEQNRDLVQNSLQQVIDDNIDTIIVAAGGGGGTGSSFIEPTIEILSDFRLPIGIIYTLPMVSEGSITKSNAIKTLDRLARLANQKLIDFLIIVDNAKIEKIYPNITMNQFWTIANTNIVEPLHLFNILSSKPSQYTSFDPMDFIRILSTGNCTIYGKMDIPVKKEGSSIQIEEDEIARAVVKNLEKGLLADGFNLKESVRAGAIIISSEEILSQIPALYINYAFSVLNEVVGEAGLYRGVYYDSRQNNIISVYSIFSGLGLPRERVDNLIRESEEELKRIGMKEEDIKKMSVLSATQTIQEEKNIYQEIKERNTSFSRIVTRDRKKTRG